MPLYPDIPNSPWISYTPTLGQPAATPVAKTVTYAQWIRIGKTAHVQVSLLVTGTGTAGQVVEIGLPIAVANTAYRMMGSGGVWDNSTGLMRFGFAVPNSATTVGLAALYGDSAWLGQAEFTAALAVNDEVYLDMTYEVL